MPQMFESNGRVYDVEIFQCGDSDLGRNSCGLYLLHDASVLWHD